MSKEFGDLHRSFSPTEGMEGGKCVVQVFPGSGPFADGPCKALIIGVAGLLNLFDCASMDARGVPFQAGYTDLGIQEIRSGGTASNIWAVY